MILIREKISLNGSWDWHIPDGKKQKVTVPSSYFCVGEAIFEKGFYLADFIGESVFLCFDAICNTGKVSVNGVEMGSLLPYVPYKFEVSTVVNQGNNKITVYVNDLETAMGQINGWESYGGIIRDVYIEKVPSIYIKDYQWITDLKNNFNLSDCKVNIWLHNTLSSSLNCEIRLNISYNGNLVHLIKKETWINAGQNEVQLHFTIENPLLWSPASPNLYRIEISLLNQQGLIDLAEQKVGFREFKTKGTRFHLNGQDIFLKGVCRHDLWGNGQGYTLTREQMEQDMMLIKSMGANYVRAVHYPHHKYIIELADQIGLMISEEPGLWGDSLTDEKIKQSALEVMRRTILRDRNNCSVIFWLLSNESSVAAVDYLSRGKEMCKDLDPARPISAANNRLPEEAKESFFNTGMDFYTFHPYGYVPDQTSDSSLKKALTVLNDKPVIFTEWGGWLIHNNSNLFGLFEQFLTKYANDRSPDINLAGMSYWMWNDIPFVNRGKPGCEDGLLSDGLVDINRRKKPMFYTMSDFFTHLDYPVKSKKMEVIERIAGIDGNKEYIPIDLAPYISSNSQKKVWNTALKELTEKIRGWEHSRANETLGPVIIESLENIGEVQVKISYGRPLIFTEEYNRLEIEIGTHVDKIYFYGHVTFVEGYPIYGGFGEEVARYVLVYDDGSEKQMILKNGIDFASSSMIKAVSRINPIAVHTQRALKLTIDPDFEIFQVNFYEVEADANRKLDKIVFELTNPKYKPLLYGITLVKGGD